MRNERSSFKQSIMEYDSITKECEATLQKYIEFNEEVEELHSHNSHLFLRPIIIHEPNSKNTSARRLNQNPEDLAFHLDPLPVTLETLDFEFKYENYNSLPPEAIQFQVSHTIPYYRQQQKNYSSRPYSPPSKHADSISLHARPIPKRCSLSTKENSYKKEIRRKLRMRNYASKTAREARNDQSIPIPKKIQKQEYIPPPKELSCSQTILLMEHEETKKALQASLYRRDLELQKSGRLTKVRKIPRQKDYPVIKDSF